MHIHGNSFQIHPAAFEAGAAARKAAEEERAAETRRRLLRGAAQGASAAADDETLLISHWLDGRHSQDEAPAEYRTAATGRDLDLG
ncbi:MAG: hypothetical protein WCE75_01745 [Terracidiphilus sp.]